MPEPLGAFAGSLLLLGAVFPAHGRAAEEGWACMQTERSSTGPVVQVQVSRSGEHREGPELFRLQVSAVFSTAQSGPILHPLLKIEDCQAATDRDRLRYRGGNSVAQAELAIWAGAKSESPGQLRLARSEVRSDDPIPPVLEVEVVCTPTTTLPREQ